MSTSLAFRAERRQNPPRPPQQCLGVRIGLVGMAEFELNKTSQHQCFAFLLRIALGAGPSWLLMLVVRQGLVLAVVGVALGLVGAIPLALGMQIFLHDMQTVDPTVFTAVAVGLLMVGTLASYIPARRAARVDPIVVLRND